MLRDVAARGAEIDQHRRSVAADDDVVRRDVAMQEIGGMDQRQRVEQGRHHAVEFVLARRAAERLEPCLEALPVLVVQDDETGVVLPKEAIDTDDVGVVEARKRSRLIEKAIETPLVVTGAVAGTRLGRLVGIADREVDREILLDRDQARERRLLGQIRDPETAGAEDALDAVVLGEARANGKGGEIGHGRRGARAPSMPREPIRAFESGRSLPGAALTDPQPPCLSVQTTDSTAELAITQRPFPGNNVAEGRGGICAIEATECSSPQR